MKYGKLINYDLKPPLVKVEYEHQTIYLTFISPKIIRVSCKSAIDSHAVDIKYKSGKIATLSQKPLQLTTGMITVKIEDNGKIDFLDRNNNCICRDYRYESAVFKNKKIRIQKEIGKNEVFYGLGESGGFLNKKHYSYVLWNSDNPEPHNENFRSLYKSVPFYIGLCNAHSYGVFFDNTYKTYFDFGKTDSDVCTIAADDGVLDYYFIDGPTLEAVVTGYTNLTGRVPLPSLWTLGHHQCRWSYYDEMEIRELVAAFRKNSIPLDAVYLDIDYMDQYKVFTVNKKRFPDLSGLVSDLKKQGVKVVAIVDPGIKVEANYVVFGEGKKKGYFALTPAGKLYHNVVWPGPAVYPSFFKKAVRTWWGNNLRFLLERGIAGIWNDMNEPATFAGAIPDNIVFPGDQKDYTHDEAHNIYGHYMAKATYESIKDFDGRRPFVITRACFAGSQKFSTVWTGDNHSLWAHLQMSIPQVCNLGLSGLAFCGVDIGGFGGDVTKELLIRWVQAACFFPLFRNHSAVGTRRQEPWTFDRETVLIYRRYVKMRYRFIPYLYDLFFRHQIDGSPVIRPLVYHYPDDIETYNINDQYMVGANLLVAPLVAMGQRKRIVYLPKGVWYEYRTQKTYCAGYHLFDCPLDCLLVFVKAGSILVGAVYKDYVDLDYRETLIIEIYGDKAEYAHYYDDGISFAYQNGDYQIYDIKYRNKELNISLRNPEYKKKYRRLLLNVNGNEREVVFNGNDIRLKI